MVNELPGIIYLLGSIYLCCSGSSIEMQRMLRVTNLIDTTFACVGFIFVLDKVFLDLTYQRPQLVFWLWPINQDNHHTIRMFLLYAYALLSAFFIYDYHLRKHLGGTQPRTIRINHSDHTEIGRSRLYLQFPPSPNVQELLTLLDEYYLQANRRPIVRKHRGLRRQRIKTFELITFSETGTPRMGATGEDVIHPVMMVVFATQPTSAEMVTQAMLMLGRASTVRRDPTTVPATMLLRRCKSLESMPNFRLEEYYLRYCRRAYARVLLTARVVSDDDSWRWCDDDDRRIMWRMV